MYDSRRREFYWLHMANNAYTTMSSCSACAQSHVELKPITQLRLFSARVFLELIAIKMLGLLPCTAEGSKHKIIITDRYSKLMRVLPTDKTSSAYVANVFFDSWIVPYGITNYVLADDEV